ncbi:uncharacterized protein METZ01_LOCUS329473 [marine metagenome]|uniref:Uncharacterized protein n=1 Tax=marine metagenome TaxID=408172 RepID=A0A382PTF5_9ZZZZ
MTRFVREVRAAATEVTADPARTGRDDFSAFGQAAVLYRQAAGASV